jgi:hypothetical protein
MKKSQISIGSAWHGLSTFHVAAVLLVLVAVFFMRFPLALLVLLLIALAYAIYRIIKYLKSKGGTRPGAH